MKSLAGFVLSLLLAISPASAQTWTGPDLERRPRIMGQGDIDFALSELCFPYILQGVNSDELVARYHLPRGFGSRAWAGGQPFYLVGQADVFVSFNFSPLEFTCSVRIGSGNVEEYRTAIEARLATWPTPLILSTRPQPLGGFQEQLLYCSAPGGENQVVLVSLGGGRRVAAWVTVGRFASRPTQCDPPLP